VLLDLSNILERSRCLLCQSAHCFASKHGSSGLCVSLTFFRPSCWQSVSDFVDIESLLSHLEITYPIIAKTFPFIKQSS
jgi:hypothetical protein